MGGLFSNQILNFFERKILKSKMGGKDIFTPHPDSWEKRIRQNKVNKVLV